MKNGFEILLTLKRNNDAGNDIKKSLQELETIINYARNLGVKAKIDMATCSKAMRAIVAPPVCQLDPVKKKDALPQDAPEAEQQWADAMCLAQKSLKAVDPFTRGPDWPSPSYLLPQWHRTGSGISTP